jgi:hypothetical protein
MINNNVMPYASNITISVNSSQQLWFAPNTIIIGTALPDRSGGDNPGVINYGVNPVGINTALGSMVSTGQPVISQVTDTPAISVMPDIVVSDWHREPAVSTTLMNSPFRPLVIMVSDPSSLTEQQTWRWYGLAVVLVVTIGTAKLVRGHYLITGIACGASIGALTAYTVWPLWGLIFMVMAVVAGMVAQTELGTNRGN